MTREENYEQTLLTVANAAYLGAQVIVQMQCSAPIADHVGSNKITLDMARGMVLARIRARFKIRDAAASAAAAGAGATNPATDSTGLDPETPAQ